MIVWKGFGYVIGFVVVAILICAEFFVEAFFRDGFYYQDHGWPKLMGLWSAAVAVWLLNAFMIKRRERVARDPDAEARPPEPDAFLFVDVRYWPYILLVLGVVFLLV